jgi:hypothetical protein
VLTLIGASVKRIRTCSGPAAVKAVIQVSKILTDFEHETLRCFVAEGKAKAPEFKLLYRGSRDGFDGSVFDRLCDGKGPTVTVVQTPNGSVFGGYASVSWDSSNGLWVSAPGCFLFTLRNTRSLPPQTFALTKPQYAMLCTANCGPTFGDGFDLYVASAATTSSESYSILGQSYALPAGCTSDLLAGTRSFTVSEVEVFGRRCALSCSLQSELERMLIVLCGLQLLYSTEAPCYFRSSRSGRCIPTCDLCPVLFSLCKVSRAVFVWRSVRLILLLDSPWNPPSPRPQV